MGITCTIPSKKDLDTLITCRKDGTLDEIKQFFNTYDIYICPPRRANQYLQVLGC